MPKPDADLNNRHPAFRCFFEREVMFLRWEIGPFLPSLFSPDRYRQIRLKHARSWIDSSTCNLSLVIYVFRKCENGRIAAFEIVEVCGVDTVIPNNGTTINLVRVA